MKKRLLGIALVAVMIVGTVGCSSSDPSVDDAVDQVTNVVQSDDENVLCVKGGTNSIYPGVTYEEAFEEFFADPTWKYFKGMQEGPDDDGDGEPDYTNNDIDVVEFTGRCTYQDVEVKALIQFTLDKDAGTFDAAYLSFNEVPQSSAMLSALISTAFESYIESHSTTQNTPGSSSETDLSETESYTDAQEEDSDNGISYTQPVIGTYSKEWVEVHVSKEDDVYAAEALIYANENTVSAFVGGDLEMNKDGSYYLYDESNDIYVDFEFYDGGMAATILGHEDDAYGVINGVYELTEELDSSESSSEAAQPVLGTYSKEWVDVCVSKEDDVYVAEVYIYANENTLATALSGDLEISEYGSYYLSDEANGIYVDFEFYDDGMGATILGHEDDVYGTINGVYELTEEYD